MAELVELRNDRLVLKATIQGGSILAADTVDGRSVLRPYRDVGERFDVALSACFPLVPVCNRVEGNAFEMDGQMHRFEPNTPEPFYIHGDGWLDDWTIERQTDTDLRLSFGQFRPAHSPHIYRATQSIRLDGPQLRMTISVKNLGSYPMPFGIGFHPYFPRTAQTRLEAPAAWWWTEGEGCLPVARENIPPYADFASPRALPSQRLNNAFEQWNRRARILWPDERLVAEIEADPIFPVYMLYAPEDDASFFCLEPMSHLPNALKLQGPAGLHVLPPGETLSGGFSITVSDYGSVH